MSLRNLTDDEYYALIESHGHVLRREADGRIDAWGLEYEYHNGPICVRCHETWCAHCRDKVSMCDEAGQDLFPLTADDARKS